MDPEAHSGLHISNAKDWMAGGVLLHNTGAARVAQERLAEGVVKWGGGGGAGGGGVAP